MAHRVYTGKHNCSIGKTDMDSKCMGKDKYSICEIRNLGQSNNNRKVFQSNNSSSGCSLQG